jgi:hypothetical protein
MNHRPPTWNESKNQQLPTTISNDSFELDNPTSVRRMTRIIKTVQINDDTYIKQHRRQFDLNLETCRFQQI